LRPEAFGTRSLTILARFPQTKSLDTFDFTAQPSLSKALVLELARCEWIEKRQSCIALGPSGTGKTHAALALGLAACQRGVSVAFTTAAALVHELMEAREEHRLRALQKHLNTVKLLIVDELGYVPFTAVGSELLEVFSQRYERGATLVTKKAQRRPGQGLSASAKQHPPKERLPSKSKSTPCNKNKPGLRSPFLLTRLEHYHAAIRHICLRH
jgi:DNA replication protein DnaC